MHRLFSFWFRLSPETRQGIACFYRAAICALALAFLKGMESHSQPARLVLTCHNTAHSVKPCFILALSTSGGCARTMSSSRLPIQPPDKTGKHFQKASTVPAHPNSESLSKNLVWLL